MENLYKYIKKRIADLKMEECKLIIAINQHSADPDTKQVHNTIARAKIRAAYYELQEILQAFPATPVAKRVPAYPCSKCGKDTLRP